jgi:hypothetical protein
MLAPMAIHIQRGSPRNFCKRKFVEEEPPTVATAKIVAEAPFTVAVTLRV